MKYYIQAQEYINSIFDSWREKRTKKKEQKEQARYEKLCASFNFIINPFDVPERYVGIDGKFYRIQFCDRGVEFTDEQGKDVFCRLTRLRILERLSKEIKCKNSN
ncbi:hypothetical protein [Photobacterium damselae]|uniref:hypothetical protein n=1 Tax=Photobacterium damselae TaxID=38293 RepID=UPI00165DAAB9|nr:hypothetical protein [Photobacterium damselae]